MQNKSFPVPSNPRDFSPGSLMDQLRSAIIPSESCISQLSSYINESERELRALDAKFRSRRPTLALEETRNNIQSTHDQAKGLCAPIRRLSVEILGEIFSLCVESQESVIFSERSQVMSLSQVCHWWREIIGTSPQLWASVPWDIDVYNDKAYPMVSHFLSKSQNAPLNLRFSLDTPGPKEILRTLLGQSDRWRSASLISDEYLWKWLTYELRTRPRPVDGYFPNLQSLTISDEDNYLSKPLNRIYMFETAPNLSSFTINNLNGYFTLPYSQLKALQVNNKCDNTLMHQCRNLEKLDLTIDEEFPIVHTSVSFPTYTALSTLVLRSCYPDLCSWAFRTLTFPSLTRLELFINSIDDKPRRWPVEDLQSLISRSGCALEMLIIDGPFLLTEDEFYETYRVLPSLTHLEIKWYRHYSDGFDPSKTPCSTSLLNSLTIKEDVQSQHQVLLPRLTYLVMNNFYLDVELAQKFVEMVNSRKRLDIPGVAPLGKVEFVDYVDFEGVELSSIQNCVRPRLISSGVTGREEFEGSGPERYTLWSL